jgi:hypothetical protein
MSAAHALPPSSPPVERLYRNCLFCGAAFGENALFGRIPPGHRLTFDPARGRIWSICERCGRWNLIPLDERLDAMDVLERVVHDDAELIAATDNIALYRYEDLTLVRVGRAALVERAWWRYGRELQRRDAALRRPVVRLASRAVGAVADLGERAGMWRLGADWGPTPGLDLVRWRRFGSDAWYGRSACPFCNSVLHTLRFDTTWWLYPRIVDGRLVVGVPCTRCDPWSPRNVFDVSGDDAELVLRRVLAYQHIGGAGEWQVREATRLLERAGSSAALVAELATGRSSLWRLGSTRALALEIALNHVAEQRALVLRLHGVEAQWRTENALAGIVDDELS